MYCVHGLVYLYVYFVCVLCMFVCCVCVLAVQCDNLFVSLLMYFCIYVQAFPYFYKLCAWTSVFVCVLCVCLCMFMFVCVVCVFLQCNVGAEQSVVTRATRQPIRNQSLPDSLIIVWMKISMSSSPSSSLSELLSKIEGSPNNRPALL